MFIRNLKNALTIPIPEFGIKILVVFLLITGCATEKQIRKSGKILKEYNTYYLNDSLKLSYVFPADYLEEKKRRKIKNRIHT